MITNCANTSRARRWATGIGLVGGAAVAAAMIGAAGAPAARADDISPDIGLAASSGNRNAKGGPGAGFTLIPA
jgi:hypothetical protein